jgi:hypothetical protein
MKYNSYESYVSDWHAVAQLVEALRYKPEGRGFDPNWNFSSLLADPSGRAVRGVSLWPLACGDCGFESRRGLGCLSVVCVVCCQVEVSATS